MQKKPAAALAVKKATRTQSIGSSGPPSGRQSRWQYRSQAAL